jgi:deaminated glutathione amidase
MRGALTVRIALSQFDPTPDPAENAAFVVAQAERAAGEGADLLLAPEGSIVSFLTDPAAPGRAAEPADGPFGSALLQASVEFGITVAAGSFVPAGDRVHNTLLVAQDGAFVARYRKVHLYDAFSFLESETVAPGDTAPPVVEIAGVPVGFATCYDLRFPELFRLLADGGAQVLAVASAWVKGPLKEEHWLTLLRARAIENTSYVVSADQIGRAGIGRSVAFDPFGLQLIDLGTAAPGFGLVDIDPDRVAEVRASNPALANRRFRVSRTPE